MTFPQLSLTYFPVKFMDIYSSIKFGNDLSWRVFLLFELVWKSELKPASCVILHVIKHILP